MQPTSIDSTPLDAVAPPPEDELKASTVEAEVKTEVEVSVDSSFLQAAKRARTQTIPNRFFDIILPLFAESRLSNFYSTL
jgi:hypothetical protein